MRIAFAAILALAPILGAATQAHATEFKVTLVPHNRAELVQAARDVCRQATAHDLDGEFGTLSDCIATSLALSTTTPTQLQSAAR